MDTMNKTIDENPIKPYLVTLKVNSKKPYKNSEASVKVVKDGKRYKPVGNFKLKKPKIEVDFYYGFVVANHAVLSHLAINGTDHQLKRLITRVLFPATTDIGKTKKSGNAKPQIVRFSGLVGATASKVKSKGYYQLQIPYQMH
ncbi:Protein of unknown function [Lactobacillus equicursoris DSM 19284 = JCM 14600 = CIP 110162]|nr:Protein of unknown function [Lactobacillus equicursoris DSM 19284 = JCM 14600 = CIP 110162]